MLAAVIDVAALWKIVVVVLLVGVGVTAIFGQGVASLERRRAARRAGRTGAVALHAATVAVAAVVCAAALVLGFVAMTHK